MSLKKRLVAGCAAVIMAMSLAGCGNKTGYIMKADGEEIASGVYISLMLSEYTNQLYSIYYSGGELADTFETQKIDGKPMSEYLEQYAYETCLEIAAVEKKCEELGVKLSDEEKKEINDAVNSSWQADSAYYEEMGISKDSLKRIQNFSYLSNKLFEAMYYEGGVEAVTTDELNTYVKDNLLRYKMIYIAIDEEDADAAKEMSDKYMGYAEEGKTMDELIEMYEEETAEEDEESDSESDTEADDSSSDTDSSSEEDSSETDSEADDSSVEDSSSETDSSSVEDSSVEDSSSETDSSSVEDSSVEDSSSEADGEEVEEEEKTAAELESEKYPNEYVRDVNSYEDDPFIDFVSGLEYGKISSYSDDDGYYIIERLDMSERTEFAEANKESLISAMKSDAYEALIKSVVDGLKVEKNEKSFEKYNAIDVYDRQNEWYEKNQ